VLWRTTKAWFRPGILSTGPLAADIRSDAYRSKIYWILPWFCAHDRYGAIVPELRGLISLRTYAALSGRSRAIFHWFQTAISLAATLRSSSIIGARVTMIDAKRSAG
jgi:hypothetical protein